MTSDSGPSSGQPGSLHGSGLTNRSVQQRGGMASGSPMAPLSTFSVQATPEFPTGGSPRSPGIPPLLLEVNSTKLLMPSRRALIALLVLPELLWFLVVLVGVTHTEPIPYGLTKSDFEHPLAWFDRHVFRLWGPLLPLVPYLVRLMSMGLRAPTPAASPTGSKPLCRRLLPGMTLPLPSLLLQLVLILSRLALYLGHLAMQRRNSFGGPLLSDHLLLAASVLAGFQAELVMCMSDVFKIEMLQPMHRSTGLRQFAVVAALVSSVFVMVAILADMYCTARWYHHPLESLVALLAGTILFQVPVMIWLWKKYAEKLFQTVRGFF